MAGLAVGVLASGEGTTLSALLAACADGSCAARIVAVITDVAGAGALARARAAGVPLVVAVPRREFPDRASHEAALEAQLAAAGVEFVVLGGYLRLLSPAFVQHWEGKLLNVHPSLLPAFPGMHAPAQALARGVKLAGCTVHLVDEGTDSGPIVAQAAVPVLSGDTEATLHARIQQEERRLLPWVLSLFADGRVKLSGHTVHVDGIAATPPVALTWPAASADGRREGAG